MFCLNAFVFSLQKVAITNGKRIEIGRNRDTLLMLARSGYDPRPPQNAHRTSASSDRQTAGRREWLASVSWSIGPEEGRGTQNRSGGTIEGARRYDRIPERSGWSGPPGGGWWSTISQMRERETHCRVRGCEFCVHMCEFIFNCLLNPIKKRMGGWDFCRQNFANTCFSCCSLTTNIVGRKVNGKPSIPLNKR